MTIKLLIVGDGERDGAMLPPIVSGILQRPVDAQNERWASTEYRVHHGYQRKLLIAIRRAKDQGKDGVVGVVDADNTEKRGERLRKLRAGREQDRQENAPFPTAIGIAVPHGEAWLLDDAHAVAECLQLGGTDNVRSWQDCKSPKDELTTMHRGSVRENEPPVEICREIASLVLLARCRNSDKTGFADFVNDLTSEFDTRP